MEVELPYFQHQNLHAIFPPSCCNPRGGHWHCDWRGKRCPGRWHRRHRRHRRYRSSYPGGWQHLGACWYMLIYDHTIYGGKTGYTVCGLCVCFDCSIYISYGVFVCHVSCVCVFYSVRECLCKHVSMFTSLPGWVPNRHLHLGSNHVPSRSKFA